MRCRHCGGEFSPDASGTRHRNHCPWCLWSVQVDDKPGDRASDCHGGMEPIAIHARPDGEWLIVHQGKSCFTVHINRTAGDDSVRELLALAVRTLSRMPFPL